MTTHPVGAIEPLSVNAIELAHTPGSIAFDRFNGQVVIIGHLTIAVNHPVKAMTDRHQHRQP
jgi:hypothetical protein